jgi:radical SAM-linked protein
MEKAKSMQPIKYPLKVIFRKSKNMIYFSQLDLVKVLERALRRTTLPLYFTQGFNPHVKLSFNKALKLGIEGEIEVTLYFSRKISLSLLQTELSPQLPSGLEIFIP